MDADLIRAAGWWSWRRQRLDRASKGMEDALRSVIAVPSAHPWGPLALLARVPRLLRGMWEGAIETRLAVRVPAMRRSIFLMPADTAPFAFRAAARDAPYKWLLRNAGISEQQYETLKRAIEEAAQSPKFPEEIREAVSLPDKALAPLLTALCGEGALLRVRAKTLRGNALAYCATRAWLGGELRTVPPAEALVWLAGDYLNAFGPATAEDFAWWAGVRPQDAREALAAHDPTDVGDGLLLHRRDLRAFDNIRPLTGRVNLLPKWDPYTMGYAGQSRLRFADARMLPKTYDTGGNALPVVLVDGRVAGRWDLAFARDRARITVDAGSRPGAKLREAVETEARMVGALLEASETEIEWRGASGARRAADTPANKGAQRGGVGRERGRRAAKPERASRPQGEGRGGSSLREAGRTRRPRTPPP